MIEIALLQEARSTDATRWAAARDLIRRANRADPDDALILVEYYRAFERQGGRPPRNALAGLAHAFELVPQDFSLRTLYAHALIQDRRFREAVVVLTPVAYSALASAAGEVAARLIETIRTLPDGAAPPPGPTAPPVQGGPGSGAGADMRLPAARPRP